MVTTDGFSDAIYISYILDLPISYFVHSSISFLCFFFPILSIKYF